MTRAIGYEFGYRNDYLMIFLKDETIKSDVYKAPEYLIAIKSITYNHYIMSLDLRIFTTEWLYLQCSCGKLFKEVHYVEDIKPTLVKEKTAYDDSIFFAACIGIFAYIYDNFSFLSELG